MTTERYDWAAPPPPLYVQQAIKLDMGLFAGSHIAAAPDIGTVTRCNARIEIVVPNLAGSVSLSDEYCWVVTMSDGTRGRATTTLVCDLLAQHGQTWADCL